jgi:hypothetical protein
MREEITAAYPPADPAVAAEKIELQTALAELEREFRQRAVETAQQQAEAVLAELGPAS